MYQKVLLGGAFGVLTTIVYHFLFWQTKYFCDGKESINFQVFRGKKAIL